jgi:thioredoxin reductase (NADPH)
MQNETLDCLIVGAGPAGLTAAIYLARFHRRVLVAHDGRSRASWIPRSHNHAGYPEGVNGLELIAAMTEQACRYGAQVERVRVEGLRREGDSFVATLEERQVTARTVLLATGVVNHKPAMDEEAHSEAMQRGLLRYCPVCDAYEVTDKRVGVLGTGAHGAREALFLRDYTDDVTLVAPDGPHSIDEANRRELTEAAVAVVDGPARVASIGGPRIAVEAAGTMLEFDSLYPALGSHNRSKLAHTLGAVTADDGSIVVDEHQQTCVPGLFAAGDVVKALDQISVAMGHAAVASTAIHNLIRQRSRA